MVRKNKPKLIETKDIIVDETIVNKKVKRLIKLHDRQFVVYLGYGTYDRSGVILEHGEVTEVSEEHFAWLKDQWQVHPVDITKINI